MPNIPKPTDINNIWATTGSIVPPDSTKVSTGWIVEIPPHEQANWVENRQDRFNAHINQHGIPLWDSATEYQASLSYSKGSNGTVYRAVRTNSNVNPVTDTTGAWTLAFSPSGTSGLQRFTSSGSFTVPTGKTTLYLTGCGGGGGGGGGAGKNSASGSGAGGGGGAGNSAIKVAVTVTPGQVIPVTIGIGATRGNGGLGNADGTNGYTGGTTSFGTLLTLAGGQGGGGGGTAPPSGGRGGTPGGTWGGDGIQSGKAGDGGAGASGPFGTGGGGGRARSSEGESGPSAAAGFGAGGGGGGAAYSQASNGMNGGEGRPGFLLVEWF